MDKTRQLVVDCITHVEKDQVADALQRTVAWLARGY